MDWPFRIRDWATGRPYPAVNMDYDKTIVAGAENRSSGIQDTTLDPELHKLPINLQEKWRWAQTLPDYPVTVDNEMTWSPEELAIIYANKNKPGFILGNIPLIVITRGDGGNEGLPQASDPEDERMRLQ